jgi:HK97 family phage prohead protease
MFNIAGYCVVFNQLDDHRDIILPNSVRWDTNIKFLLEHKTHQEIGKVLKIMTNNYGVYINAKIENKFIAEQIKNKSYRGLSIGYKTIKAKIEQIKNARILQEIIIKEISLVSHPANYKSIIRG